MPILGIADYCLQVAHQKYNSQDYLGAFNILNEIRGLNETHLPTLLLLGCTCYSLNMFELSITYNQQILNIDPSFAEAYSNLGTTYRVSIVVLDSKLELPNSLSNRQWHKLVTPEYKASPSTLPS